MAVVFPNIAIDQFRWRKTATDKKIDSELEKYLDKPNQNRIVNPTPNKIHMEWPAIFSSDCSTWLSTRKAESDKKQTEKRKADDNIWLLKGGVMPCVELANSVCVGLLKAGSIQASEEQNKKVNCRIPLPITEDAKKSEGVQLAISQSAQVKKDLMAVGSVSMQKHSVTIKPKPWAPKSLIEEVRIGILRANGEAVQSKIERASTPNPIKSLAESLKNSLLSIKVDQPSSPSTNNIADSLRESLLNISSSDPVQDHWISDDNQSGDNQSGDNQSGDNQSDDNPWLEKAGTMSGMDLANTVCVGLFRAGSVQMMESSPEKIETKEECRIPLQMTEEMSEPKNAEKEELVANLSISHSAQVKMGLMRAGNISMQPCSVEEDSAKKPWAPKSLAERVRMGLLKAGRELKIEDYNPQVNVEETAEPEVKIGSTPDPFELLAETLKKSLMSIKVDQPPSPLKTSIADSMRESLLNISSSDAEEEKSESLDNWIIDDNQSEASIITLDTITDSLDMEEFDDFEGMEHELSMWIANA